MIITLTPNPSLDRTMEIETLVRGAVIRASRSWTEPAGKGVNISRALASAGIPTRAVLPVGGAVGAELSRLLASAGVDHIPVAIEGEVRSNVSVVEPDGTVTKLNEAGPLLEPDDADALIDAVVGASGSGDWVAASGSLAPGLPPDFYAQLATRLSPKGASLAVDTSGAPLAGAIAGTPSLVKPNQHELGDLVSRRLGTLGDVIEAAEDLRRQGVDQVLVSLGEDGAVLVDRSGATHAKVQVTQVRNTVGAGDALLAGYLAAGADGRNALVNALAWARCAVQSSQTMMEPPGPADAAAVTVQTSIESGLLLADTEPSPTDLEAHVGDRA